MYHLLKNLKLQENFGQQLYGELGHLRMQKEPTVLRCISKVDVMTGLEKCLRIVIRLRKQCTLYFVVEIYPIKTRKNEVERNIN